MITLLSPAKTLDETSPLPTRKHTLPRLLDDSADLIDALRRLTTPDVAHLLHISDELAALNARRYQDWEPPFNPANARPAVFLFAGDVYVGMNPRERFDARDLTQAQKSLRILSGLYGLLRPLDLIQPYRLEMGTSLRTSRGKNLYEFWGDRITDLLRGDLDASPGSAAVVDLASAEYGDAIDHERVGVPVVAPRFEDESPQGRWRITSFYAKRARGDMAAWIVTQRIRSPRALRDYDGLGYRFARDVSTPAVPVFRRPRQAV